MKARIYILMIIWMAVLVTTLASASLGISKVKDCVNIQVLANCSSVNLTQISNKNQTFVINSPMTNLGGQTFNYTFCNTSTQGEYRYTWNNPCVDCSAGDCGNSFEVTYTGDNLTTGKAAAYILIFIISLLIFAGLLWFGVSIPSKNKSDEMTGYIIAVSNLKYLKYLFLAFAYLTALLIAFFAYQVSYAYLDLPFLTTLFYSLFIVEAYATLPLFIIAVVIVIANLIRDSKVADALQRGLKTK